MCFEQIKAVLCSLPVFKLPDFTKPFNMEPYASDVAVEAVLLQ